MANAASTILASSSAALLQAPGPRILRPAVVCVLLIAGQSASVLDAGANTQAAFLAMQFGALTADAGARGVSGLRCYLTTGRFSIGSSMGLARY